MSYTKIQEDFFDKMASKTIQQNFLEMAPAMKKEFDTFINFLNLPKGSKILELGCGVGRYTIPLLKIGYVVTAIDISERSIYLLKNEAKRLCLDSNLQAIKSDFSKCVMESEFDGAFAINLLHHLENRNVQFYNMVKAIKPNGVLLIVEPNPMNPFYYPYYFVTGSWSIEKGFIRSKEKELVNLFNKFGLREILMSKYALFPTRIGNKLPVIFKINSFLEKNPLFKKFSLFTFIKGYKSDE